MLKRASLAHCVYFITASLCLTSPASPTSFSCCLVAVAGQADRSNTANTFAVRATSLGWYPSHEELRSAMRLTHRTLEEKQRGQRVYRSPHGRCLRGNYPYYSSSVLLYTLPISLVPCSVLHCKGVAGAPQGPIFFL